MCRALNANSALGTLKHDGEHVPECQGAGKTLPACHLNFVAVIQKASLQPNQTNPHSSSTPAFQDTDRKLSKAAAAMYKAMTYATNFQENVDCCMSHTGCNLQCWNGMPVYHSAIRSLQQKAIDDGNICHHVPYADVECKGIDGLMGMGTWIIPLERSRRQQP